MEVRFLRGFIHDLASAASPEAIVLDRIRLQDLVLTALLDDEPLRHPELEPVLTYLYAAGKNRDAVDRRGYQLSRELTRLFDEVAVSRPDFLECCQSWSDELVIAALNDKLWFVERLRGRPGRRFRLWPYDRKPGISRHFSRSAVGSEAE